MIKLYKQDNEEIVAYHEAWINGSKIIEHWGKLGDKGSMREHRINNGLSEEENLENILESAITNGFRPINIDEHAVLIIEYAIDGTGSPADLKKRHALEDHMNEVLGWTGLGCCDGGSIGSGTMEVCCFVVDFKTAQMVIANDLRGTEFSNYIRIYDEDEE